MHFIFEWDTTTDHNLALEQDKFNYNCSQFKIQEIELRQQIDQAKRLLASLNELTIARMAAELHRAFIKKAHRFQVGIVSAGNKLPKANSASNRNVLNGAFAWIV